MLTSQLDFHLPDRLIATRPVEPRDACRLMVIHRSDPSKVEHRRFSDLPEYLRADDLLVFNTSAVLPARLRGKRADTGAAVEGLFVREVGGPRWRVMLRTGTKLRPEMVIALTDRAGSPTPFALRLIERDEEQWLAEPLEHGQITPAGPGSILAQVGATPLPPYIRKARRDRAEDLPDEQDRDWYQCVYADTASGGSVAAPTAGMHFTPALLDRLGAMGVARADVVLHVGPGTFKPVESDTLEQHPIHSEWVSIPTSAMAAMDRARAGRGRVVAVGTTSVRAIESLPWPVDASVQASGFAGDTRLFITPGFAFRHTDALLTNFHLPRSTLLALVAAMLVPKGGSPEQGLTQLLAHYNEAVREGYRFYSYGDAMLLI